MSNNFLFKQKENILKEYKESFRFIDEEKHTNGQQHRKNTSDLTGEKVLLFLNEKQYDQIKNMISRLYLKILKMSDNTIALTCKIIIGNRLNKEDEIELFKNANNDLLFFFSFNSSILKSNKQNLLLHYNNPYISINTRKTSKEKNDFFDPKICTFFKILLIIFTYNVNSFTNSEYYQTIKQIISDNQWFRFFDRPILQNKKIQFLCKRMKYSLAFNDNENNDASSTSSSSSNTSDSGISDLLNMSYLSETLAVEESEEEVLSTQKETGTEKNMEKNADVERDKDSYISSEKEDMDGFEMEASNMNTDFFQESKNEIEQKKKDADINIHKEREIEKEIEREIKKENKNEKFITEIDTKKNKEKSINPENKNIYEQEDEDEPFKLNFSKTKDKIFNEYGKGFLFSFINELNCNEESEKHFAKIYKKSNMINLLKYSQQILKYWKLEADIKSKENEGIKLLLFLANYYYFFQNAIKYKIVLNLYIQNNFNEADELLGNATLWNWYRNETKIKNDIRNFLNGNISYAENMYKNKQNVFLKKLKIIYYKMGCYNNRFYLQNFKKNQYRKSFIRSLFMQNFIFQKYIKKKEEGNIKEEGEKEKKVEKGEKENDREKMNTEEREICEKQKEDADYLNFSQDKNQVQKNYSFQTYFDLAKGEKNMNDTNFKDASKKINQEHIHTEGKDTFFSNNKNNFQKKEKKEEEKEQILDYTNFPLFYLSTLDIYKNSLDVYNFYYQAILYKLLKEKELNVEKIQSYFEDLKTYFINKMLNYDIFLMLLYYQYYTFQCVISQNEHIFFLNKEEQNATIFLWVRYTELLMEKYKASNRKTSN